LERFLAEAAQMAIAPNQPITLAEFLQLPETKPASEYIDGQIYQKPMPQGKHSRLQLQLCNAVNRVAEEKRIALAFPELRCTFGGRSIVPDVTVFAWERIPFDADGEIENAFEIHPDWTIEILSPDQNATKVISNIMYCLNNGTQLGWFIDPEERLVLAFFPNRQPIELTGEDILPIPRFLELNLTVAQVFGWLKAGK
jgi:Uma2 family endonuclease